MGSARVPGAVKGITKTPSAVITVGNVSTVLVEGGGVDILMDLEVRQVFALQGSGYARPDSVLIGCGG
jgi:hypothetical protein